MSGPVKLAVTIRDQSVSIADPMVTRNCEIVPESTGVHIAVEGYGDHGTQDGHGCVAYLEVWEGRLRLMVWADINVEDPQIIDLEAARESNRKPDGQV